MSVDRIAAALILANRHITDGVAYEDFNLSCDEGIEELATTALKIHRALRRGQYELGSIPHESGED